MLERCRKLERGLIGQKAERLPSNEWQLSLAVLASVLGERAVDDAVSAAAVEEVRAHQRKKPVGRNALPEDMPRVEIEILPEEVQRGGLDAFERIGEDTAEVLEHRPASMVMVRIIKPKFVRKDRERGAATEVFVGSTPELPIPRSVAGPGLLADTLVKRWLDHLPLHRLGRHHAREGAGRVDAEVWLRERISSDRHDSDAVDSVKPSHRGCSGSDRVGSGLVVVVVLGPLAAWQRSGRDRRVLLERISVVNVHVVRVLLERASPASCLNSLQTRGAEPVLVLFVEHDQRAFVVVIVGGHESSIDRRSVVWKVTTNPDQLTADVRWVRQWVPVTPTAFAERTWRAEREAFVIVAATQVNVVQTMGEEITRSVSRRRFCLVPARPRRVRRPGMPDPVPPLAAYSSH
jgi:transposase